MRVIWDHNPKHFQWINNLHGISHGKYGSCWADCGFFGGTTLQGRPGGMCNKPIQLIKNMIFNLYLGVIIGASNNSCVITGFCVKHMFKR